MSGFSAILLSVKSNEGVIMYPIYFRIWHTGGTMEVVVDNLAQAQETWDLMSQSFQMVNARP